MNSEDMKEGIQSFIERRASASAGDAQILVDPVLAERAKGSFVLVSLGERTIKGFDRALEVFGVLHSEIPADTVDSPVLPTLIAVMTSQISFRLTSATATPAAARFPATAILM
jgi:hypothetical protein